MMMVRIMKMMLVDIYQYVGHDDANQYSSCWLCYLYDDDEYDDDDHDHAATCMMMMMMVVMIIMIMLPPVWEPGRRARCGRDRPRSHPRQARHRAPANHSNPKLKDGRIYQTVGGAPPDELNKPHSEEQEEEGWAAERFLCFLIQDSCFSSNTIKKDWTTQRRSFQQEWVLENQEVKRNVFPFTLFEKWKWNKNDWKSKSRNESEIKTTRDRELKFQNKSQEFSRIETLTGHCPVTVINDIRIKVQLESHNSVCYQDIVGDSPRGHDAWLLTGKLSVWLSSQNKVHPLTRGCLLNWCNVWEF